VKRCWREHLQGHFWRLEEKYNQSQELYENKAILCPDQRCAISFDSIQNLQCHSQDVHRVERNKLDPVKRRRQAHQSCTDGKAYFGSNVQLERQSDTLNNKVPYDYINETAGISMNGPCSAIVPAQQTEPKRSNSVQDSSLPSVCSTPDHTKRSPSATSSTSS